MKKKKATGQFKKDFKRVISRGYDKDLLDEVIKILCNEEPIPAKYKAHDHTGNLAGFKELHVLNDWLLIWEDLPLEIRLARTGTHADLF